MERRKVLFIIAIKKKNIKQHSLTIVIGTTCEVFEAVFVVVIRTDSILSKLTLLLTLASVF